MNGEVLCKTYLFFCYNCSSYMTPLTVFKNTLNSISGVCSGMLGKMSWTHKRFGVDSDQNSLFTLKHTGFNSK